MERTVINTLEQSEIILAYGVNGVGACHRDGSINSYDNVFNTKEEAEKFYNEMCELGYSSKYNQPIAITLFDELRVDMLESMETDGSITNSNIWHLLIHYKTKFHIDIEPKTWNKVFKSI